MLVEVVAYFAAVVRKWRKKVDGVASTRENGRPERVQPGTAWTKLDGSRFTGYLAQTTADIVAHYGRRECWKQAALVGR